MVSEYINARNASTYKEYSEQCRDRMKDKETRVLERYLERLRPKNYMEKIKAFWDVDRIIRIGVLEEIINERTLQKAQHKA